MQQLLRQPGLLRLPQLARTLRWKDQTIIQAGWSRCDFLSGLVLSCLGTCVHTSGKHLLAERGVLQCLDSLRPVEHGQACHAHGQVADVGVEVALWASHALREHLSQAAGSACMACMYGTGVAGVSLLQGGA